MDEAELARKLHQTGHLQEAQAAYVQAIKAFPLDAGLLRDFGVLLMQARRPADALEQFGKIPAQHPAYPLSLVPRALCERETGRTENAFASAQEAIVSTPLDPVGWLLHGSLLVRRGGLEEADRSLRRCLQLAPGFGEAHHFLGECLQRQGRYREAIEHYQKALVQRPQEALNIAQCAELMGSMITARQYYEKAVSVLPRHVDAHARLLHLLSSLCDFPARESVKATIDALLSTPLQPGDVPEPFLLCYQNLSASAYRKVLENYAAQFAAPTAPIHSHDSPRRDGRMHIGYLSADFDNHAISHLVCDLFAAHDRQHFKVSGFSLRPSTAAPVSPADKGFDGFFDLHHLADAEAAALIAREQIDVLIDLGGYTLGARPSILALRPARIQLGWLGFISPHQASWMDGLILDTVVQPPDTDWPFSDRVIHMQSPLLPGVAAPAATGLTRADFGLPPDGPLLISLNSTYKLSAGLISAWAAILSACPSANLAVYAPAHAREGISAHWQRSGGDPKRLLFVDKLDHAMHLARMQCCDLMLDAFDYSAGATAMDAVAAGLPNLCLVGDTPAARMSASINHHLGLDRLMATSIPDYIDKAIGIITQPGALPAMRAMLASSGKRLELLNPRRAASEIEAICRDLLHPEVLDDKS